MHFIKLHEGREKHKFRKCSINQDHLNLIKSPQWIIGLTEIQIDSDLNGLGTGAH
jgi:hypothetical protein